MKILKSVFRLKMAVILPLSNPQNPKSFFNFPFFPLQQLEPGNSLLLYAAAIARATAILQDLVSKRVEKLDFHHLRRKSKMDLINERVKRKIGCPGTAKGFMYRLLQLGAPLVAIFSLLKDHHRDLFHFSCFKLLLTALCFQTLCSLSLCIRDAYAYKREMNLLSPIRVGCYIYWDFVAYVVVSAGAAASAAVGSLFSSKNILCLTYGQRRRKGYPSCESYMLPVIISYLGLIPIAMTGIGNIHVLKLIWTPERESPVMSRKEIVLKVAAPVIVLGVLSCACFSWIPKFIFNHVCPDCYLSTSPAPSQLTGT